jgi:hypothetical protein
VLAALAAQVTYFLCRFPEHYPDLIVGELAWGATQKTRDYLMLFAFVIGFFIALSVIARVAAALTRSTPTHDEALHAALMVALVPAAMWLFGLLLTRNDSLALLYLSCTLVAPGVAFAAALATRPEGFWLGFDEGGRFSALLVKGMIVLCLAAISGAALALAISRLDILYQFGTWASDRRTSWSIVFATTFTGFAAVGVHMARSATAVALENRLSRLLVACQLLVPLLFCVLLPTPLVIEGRRGLPYPVSTAAWITIGALVLIAYADLYRCARSRRLRASAASAALSPMCLVAIVLFVKAMPAGTGSVSADDYHFGEFLIPWWSWVQHGMTPFWDYAPARGLVNYLPGALNALVFDGTAATMEAVSGYRSTLILLVAFPPLAYAIGKGPAFLGLVMHPVANGLSEIDVVATVALCLLCELFLRSRPVFALFAWIVLGSTLVLIAPGQGGLFVLATSPLGVVLLRRAWLHQRRKLLALAAVSSALMAVVLVFTPTGLMLAGAVRYGLEHSGVNTIANAIAWADRFATMEGPNPWMWEIGRVSWIATALIAGVLVIRAAKLEPASRERLLVYAVPIFLLTLLFVVRAAGRIDVSLSRAGIASVWSLALLLPLLLFAARRPRNRAVPTIIFVSAAATVAPVFGFAPSLTLLARSAETVERQADRVSALDARLPNLGTAWVKPEHLARLVAVKEDLDRLLEPGETYLDLTNRNAHYFYFDRPPPVESGAFYNLYHRAAQVRAIASLERDPPPAVLVEADNLLHDGVRANLRAHLLYRYVLFNYVPAATGGLIWMVRPDRLHRLGIAWRSEHPAEQDLAILDRVFRSDNLRRLPMAWGYSYQALSSEMRAVARISPERIGMASPGHDAPARGDLHGRQEIIYDVTPLALAGRDAGLLSFALGCRGLAVPLDLRLSWTTRSAPNFDDSRSISFKAVNGRTIVPVDAAPRWLLANQITRLRLALEDRTACPELTIAETTLFQRTAADTLTRR